LNLNNNNNKNPTKIQDSTLKITEGKKDWRHNSSGRALA
jgi:hypothetical protein